MRIPWHDVVTVEPARGLSMTCSDPDLPVDERNTCLRAARLLAQRYSLDTGARIHLDKRVPYGAGLGSGSSDAATTLRLLVELWQLDVPESELGAIALQVGSDVPFFLNGPLAFGEGRGEQLTPLACPLTSIPPWIVVLVPPVQISSREAYGSIRPEKTGRADLRRLVCSGDIERWKESLVNDFEGPVVDRYPEVRAAREHLRSAGAAFTGLSGSGSAMFGLFASEHHAHVAAGATALSGQVTWLGTTGPGDRRLP
jgi:4-diphosphocytidyl-2-C-methyl-D-erythritol kinase